jgi:antitoxin (DNA-binding transcriptional repressor) of toxin-antitoxin stability system
VVLKEVPYEIKFAEAAIKHLGALRTRERKTVVDVIEEQLSHEPLVENPEPKTASTEPNRSVGTACGISAGILRRYGAGGVKCGVLGHRSDHGHRKKRSECVADRRRGNRPMKTLKLSQASRPLAEYADELDDEIVVLMKKNRAVAAIVPLRNVDRESLSLSTNPKFLKLIQRPRADFAAGRTRSVQEVRELFGLRAPANKAASPARGSGAARRKRASPRRRHSG